VSTPVLASHESLRCPVGVLAYEGERWLNRGSGLLIFLGGASILLGLALEKDPVDDQLRSFVWNPWCFPNFDLLFHRLKIPLNPAIPDRENVDQTHVFVCFASTGVNTPGTMLPNSEFKIVL